MRLSGKIAFITGAGGGIGREVCARFLKEGARVAAEDIDAKAASEAIASRERPDDAIAIVCDAGDSPAIQAAIAQTVAHFGSLNVLCPFAGGSTKSDGPVTEAAEEEFWRAIRLDLFGTFIAGKYGIPHLIASGGGSVINMASMVTLTAVTGRDCYTAAKGGIVTLTRSMAAQYASHGIRVNAIAPGVTRTARVMSIISENESARRAADKHLLGLVEPSDIAAMAAFLASDEARTITGRIHAVDSGVSL